jgi:hypothetical protein
VPSRCSKLDAAFAKAGRKRAGLRDHHHATHTMAPDAMKEYAALGADRLVVNLAASGPKGGSAPAGNRQAGEMAA